MKTEEEKVFIAEVNRGASCKRFFDEFYGLKRKAALLTSNAVTNTSFNFIYI
jgi:hypothetical protein